jgi:hypothetical protein
MCGKVISWKNETYKFIGIPQQITGKENFTLKKKEVNMQDNPLVLNSLVPKCTDVQFNFHF